MLRMGWLKFYLRIICIVPFFITEEALIAQTDSLRSSALDIMEETIGEATDEGDDSFFYDYFDDLLSEPVDLNSASAVDLLRIPYLDNNSADLIINYRKQKGTYKSAAELYSINGLPKETADAVIPFVTVHIFSDTAGGITDGLFTSPKISFRLRTGRVLKEQYGFAKNKFAGNPLKIYNRILVTNKKIYTIGFLTEKDPGEKNINDFTSFFLMMHNLPGIDNLLIGNYTLEFGQGLALWSPYAFAKGSEAIFPVTKRERVIIPHNGSDENRFFKGAAISSSFGRTKFSAFYSAKKFDATIDSNSGIITAVSYDGLHRTQTETANRENASEIIYGFSSSYNLSDMLKIEELYFHSNVSTDLGKSDYPKTGGAAHDFYSISYRLIYNRVSLSGETAYDGNNFSWIANLLVRLSPDAEFVNSVRHYSPAFTGTHSNGFGEKRGTAANENGYYLGLKWKTPAGIINMYFDQFRFPFASYNNPLPLSGKEFLIAFKTVTIASAQALFRFKYEEKDKTVEAGGIKLPVSRLKESLRFEFRLNLRKALILKTRIDYLKLKYENKDDLNEGISISQEVRAAPIENLSLAANAVFYSTENFESAVYTYEYGLPGTFNSVALYGEGMRWYSVIGYKINNNLSIGLKYYEIHKPGVSSIGSGYSEVVGDIYNEISLQIEAKL